MSDKKSDRNPEPESKSQDGIALSGNGGLQTLSKDDIVKATAHLEPPERAEVLSQIITSVSMQGPVPDPIRNKVNEEHISSALSAMREHDERLYRLRKQQEDRQDSNRWFALTVFVIILVAFGAICFFFKSTPDIMKPLLTVMISFGAGVLGGYGYGKSKSD